MLKKCWGAFLEPSKDLLLNMRILLAWRDLRHRLENLCSDFVKHYSKFCPSLGFPRIPLHNKIHPCARRKKKRERAQGRLFSEILLFRWQVTWQLFSCCHVWLFLTPWTVACQAPLSMGFSRQEYWSGVPFPSPGGSSQLRDPIYVSLVSCTGRRILYHCSILEALHDSSVQFRSVAQSCLTLCDPMNHSTPGLPVHHQLPESTQTHVHRVSDAIQPSHPLSSPSPPALNLSQHQGTWQLSRVK